MSAGPLSSSIWNIFKCSISFFVISLEQLSYSPVNAKVEKVYLAALPHFPQGSTLLGKGSSP